MLNFSDAILLKPIHLILKVKLDFIISKTKTVYLTLLTILFSFVFVRFNLFSKHIEIF